MFFFSPMVFHQPEIFQNVEECSWNYGLFSDGKPNFFKRANNLWGIDFTGFVGFENAIVHISLNVKIDCGACFFEKYFCKFVKRKNNK